jgi:diadenosine tetraphosphate (Ap4A) HIT family hydrolase
MGMQHCPLCPQNGLLKEPIVAQTKGAYLMPAHSSPANYLIVPLAHTESPHDLPDDWWASVKELLAKVPGLGDHYNISINLGRNAGQTVKHIHFWIIPRDGDKPSSGKGFASLIHEADRH